MSRWFSALVHVTLLAGLSAGCGQAPVAPVAPGLAESGMAAAGKSLSSKTTARFKAVFEGFDTNGDGVWKPADFKLEEKRFLNLFGKTDADDDHVVTWEEYHPDDAHDELVIHCEARARASSSGVGGHVNLDKTYYMMDAYLKPYLNKREKRKHIKQAFAEADDNGDKRLNLAELAYCYAIMEAKASELSIQKRVNRSKGQKK